MVKITEYSKDITDTFKNGFNLNNLNNSNILIAGATGLIGSCIIDFLMLNPNRKYHIYAAGRNLKRASLIFENYKEDRLFDIIELDVTKTIACNINFDYIIDAASNASPNFFKSSPVEVIKANINGVSNLLDYGIIHNLKRFLYISSGEIYGEGNGQVFDETSSGYVDCASIRACYPSSKRAAETLCIAYAEEYNIDVAIARLCHTYGPNFTKSDNRVYAQFIRNAINGEDIVLKSKGGQFRSWLYVVDCATAILTILMKGANKNAYNVANSESNVTIYNLAKLVARLTGRKIMFDIPDEQNCGNTTPITKATFNTDKIKNLAWTPHFSLEEGIKHTINTCIQLHEKNQL